MRGNLGANPYIGLRLNVIPCTTSCASNKDQLLYNARLTMIVGSQYLDFDDYETPVKKMIDDKFSMLLTPNADLMKQRTIFVRKNNAVLNDYYFNLGLPFTETLITEREFFSITDSQYDMHEKLHDPAIASYRFFVDPQEDYYSRNVFTFIDLLGQLGGVYEIFDLFGIVFVGFIAHRLFQFSILSRLYQVNTKNDNEIPDRKSRLENLFKVEPKP
jgi:hypothetical protein